MANLSARELGGSARSAMLRLTHLGNRFTENGRGSDAPGEAEGAAERPLSAAGPTAYVAPEPEGAEEHFRGATMRRASPPANGGGANEAGAPPAAPPTSAGPGEVDRLIHEPARLTIMALLYVIDSADSTFVQGRTGLSWGNLSSHTSKLERAGYVEVRKDFCQRKPRTLLRVTEDGRRALRLYRQHMQGVLAGLPD